MNVTVYIFGEFDNGYTQYPDDYTAGIFCEFYKNSKSTTQIAIHRKGSLMYYGYIRKLEQERYIGFCVVVNGLMLSKLDGLFELFEKTVSYLVTNGQLIHFNEQGNIVTNVDKLYLNREEIDLLSESFRNSFHHLKESFQSLPAVNYGVSKDSVMNYTIEDDIDEIIKSCHTYGYTYIYKSKSFNTNQLNSYKGILNRLNNEKAELIKKYDSLSEEHEKTLKQKKQYRFVAILFLIVLGCGVGLLFLNNNLNNTIFALNKANNSIKEQNDLLSTKSNKISQLEVQNQDFEQRLLEAESNLESINKVIIERQSFVIKSTSFNFSTGFLTINCYGFNNETAKIQVRAYSDDGNVYTTSTDIDVYIGNNSYEIYLSQYLSSEKWYSFEILKDKVIIGGDRH